MLEQNKKIEIKEAIYKTIVFFDIFSYPLSSFELWQFLEVKCSLSDVEVVLDEILGEKIESKEGFLFLIGRASILDERYRRYNYCDRKIKQALKVTQVFKYFPWIEMIAIGNVMGNGNLKNESDIDFFIVTKKRRIWLTRFFTNMVTKFLLLRPKVNDTKDKICLSFYISEDKLSLRPLLIDDQDRYFKYWLAGLLPIYDKGDTYAKLLDVNDWIYDFLPNWQATEASHHRQEKPMTSFVYREILDLFIGGLEKELRALQLKILPSDLKRKMNIDTRVVIGDSILKLHVNDRREKYSRMFSEKIKRLR